MFGPFNATNKEEQTLWMKNVEDWNVKKYSSIYFHSYANINVIQFHVNSYALFFCDRHNECKYIQWEPCKWSEVKFELFVNIKYVQTEGLMEEIQITCTAVSVFNKTLTSSCMNLFVMSRQNSIATDSSLIHAFVYLLLILRFL